MERLKDRTAIVTGAASGIGREIAVLFATEGAKVVVADIRETPKEGGEPTETLIRDAGGQAIRMHCDISKWEDIDAMVTRVVDEWRCLDILVNNAAHWTTTRLADTTNDAPSTTASCHPKPNQPAKKLRSWVPALPV